MHEPVAAKKDDKAPADAWEPPSTSALTTAWAANFPERKVLPKTGDRGTVGGFDEAQLKVLHRLFWSAPPGAELADITKLAKQDPAFKGATVTDDRLKLITKYRPESFPFSWSERKQSLCSFVVVEALTATPSDVPAMKVLGGLRDKFPGFLSEPVIARFARGAWKDEPKLFPFVKGKLTARPDGSGYVLAATGEVKGIARRGDSVALSAQLAHKIAGYVDDPRIKFDTDFAGLVKLISADLGVPFTESQYKHLGEKFPALPNYQAIHQGARLRFANLVRTVWSDRKPGSVGALEQILKNEHGSWVPKDTMHWSLLRKDFPGLIPEFRVELDHALQSDGAKLVAEAKKHPETPLLELGAKLGLDARRLKSVIRQVRLEDPAALPLKKIAKHGFTGEELKWVREAADAIPPGSSAFELVDELQSTHPELFTDHDLDGGHNTRAVLRNQLGVEDWRAYQRGRVEELFVKVAARSDAGVSLADLVSQLRDEYGAQTSYAMVKRIVSDAEANPKQHPELAALKKQGRFPWELGLELSKPLAEQVGAAIRAHVDQGIHAVVGALMKDPAFAAKHPAFAAKHPTFGAGHLHKLREKFPELVPYFEEVRSPAERAEQKKWAGELDALAKKAKQAAQKFPKGQPPSVASLARALNVEYRQVYRAVTRHPEDFPWMRRQASGNVDLQLAYRVAAALEQAPLETTRAQLVEALRKDDAFLERYPSFSEHTIGDLRELYPQLVPGWFDRRQTLRSALLVEALRTAPKGASFESVVAKLQKQHPGQLEGAFATKAYVEGLWRGEPERFAFAQELLKGPGLVGRGEKASGESASLIATRAARLTHVPEKLDLVEAVVATAKDQPLDSGQRYEFVLVQHLLDTQLPTFDAYKRLGMPASRTSVIGTPYSASPLVVDALRDKGWDVKVPPLDMSTWVEDVRASLYERLESALTNHRDIVVLDDGGIVSELVAHDPLLSKHASLFRIVEQTRRGITVADEVDVAVPVVNVAQSWAKFVEGPMIADSINGKLVERLEKLGVGSLKGKHIGVIGAGTIGLPIAEALRALGAIVTVLDKSEAALEKVKGPSVTTDRKKFFGGNDIIIGATGVQSITADDLKWLKDGAMIGSASSKLVEIDVSALDAQSDGQAPKVVDSDSHPPSVEYELGKKKVTLIARGFPMNFDGGVENIPPEQIQLTRALMTLGLLQATQEKVAGVRRVNPARELKLLEAFEQLGGGRGNPEVKQVLEQAMGELKEAVKNPGTHYRRRTG